MTARDLQAARQALRWGVGQTSLKQRVLPPEQDVMPIPGRVGVAPSPADRQTDPPPLDRGFVITAFGAASGARYSPYTLEQLTWPYALANASYGVQPFATSFNIHDTLLWHDVLAFSGGKIWINAATRAALEIPVALVTADATPYLIPSAEPGEPYGSSTLNASQKRVFAVARSTVRTFVPGAPEAALQPVAPRSEGRAATLGPAISPATHQATMAQIYHSQQDWQAPGVDWICSWSIVQMALASPYLTRTDGAASIMRSPPGFSAPVQSSGSSNTAAALPATEIMITGNGEVYTYGSLPNGYYNGAIVIFPWSGTVSAALAGQFRRQYNRIAHSASASANQVVAGTSVTYTATASYTSDVGTEKAVVLPQTVTVAPGAQVHANEVLQYYGDTGYTWMSGKTAAAYGSSPHGQATWAQLEESDVAGSSAQKTWQQQTVSVSVSTPDETMVSIALSRSRTIGPQLTISPLTGYYASRLANPYGNVWDGFGMGLAAKIRYYEHASVWPRPGDEVLSAMAEMADAAAAMTFYTDERQDGVTQRQHYTAALSPSQTADQQTLTWTTRDYLFRDDVNGVSIRLDGSLTGTQTAPAAGQMTVAATLRIQTRHHVNSIDLGSLTFEYAELLPRTVTLPQSGEMAFPVPRVHLSCVPAYRGQGDFRGASYITAAEEGNGSPAAHLFNFRLRLARYSEVSTLDQSNRSGPDVVFLPVNFLEALHSVVFSQGFGVAPDPYPITSQTRYDAIVQQFFAPTFAVQIRDGVQGPWPGSVRPGLSPTSRLTRT